MLDGARRFGAHRGGEGRGHIVAAARRARPQFVGLQNARLFSVNNSIQHSGENAFSDPNVLSRFSKAKLRDGVFGVMPTKF